MVHAERIENMPLNIDGEGFAGNALDDISGERDAIIGIGLDVSLGKQTLRQAFRKPAPERLGLAISRVTIL